MLRAEGYYEQGFVCRGGHLLTSFGDSQPEIYSAFCPKCGQPVLKTCPECGEMIRGHYRPAYPMGDVVNVESDRTPPNFCQSCGVSYPWTLARLEAAKEQVLLLEGLTASDKQDLNDSLDDISTDGPRAELGSDKVKALVKRVGIEAGKQVYKIAVDVASEVAKKALTGGL